MKKLLVVIVLLGGLFVTSGCQGNTRTSSENTQNAQSVESTERSVDQKQLTATRKSPQKKLLFKKMNHY